MTHSATENFAIKTISDITPGTIFIGFPTLPFSHNTKRRPFLALWVVQHQVISLPLTTLTPQRKNVEKAAQAFCRSKSSYYPIAPAENLPYYEPVRAPPAFCGFVDLITPITLGQATIDFKTTANRISEDDLERVKMAHISLVKETETKTYSEPETPPVDPDDRARIRNLASELLRLSESGYLYAKKTEEHTRRIVEVCDRATHRAAPPASASASGPSGSAPVSGYPQPQPPGGDGAGPSSPPRGTQGRQQAGNSRRAPNARNTNPVLSSPRDSWGIEGKGIGSKTSALMMNAIRSVQRKSRKRGGGLSGQPGATDSSGSEAQPIDLKSWTEDDWVILEPEPQEEENGSHKTTDSVKDDTPVGDWTLEDWDMLEGEYEDGTLVDLDEAPGAAIPDTPDSPTDDSRVAFPTDPNFNYPYFGQGTQSSPCSTLKGRDSWGNPSNPNSHFRRLRAYWKDPNRKPSRLISTLQLSRLPHRQRRDSRH